MSIFIGGDTTELIYNFSTKIEGSMTECPMKLKLARNIDLLKPESKEWNEATQINYDKLKYQNNESVIASTKNINEKAQILVELDLNNVCNSLYNNDNNLLKSNINNLSVKCYGNNSNGWEMFIMKNNDTWFKWDEGTKNLYNSSNSTYPYNFENKVYILLVSPKCTTENASSKLFLNYVDIRLKIKRKPDIIQPINLQLSEEWSILLKGISPNWNSSDTSITNPKIFEIKDNIRFYFNTDKKQFVILDLKQNNHIYLPHMDFKRFQTIVFLIAYKKGKLDVYALINNCKIEKISTQVSLLDKNTKLILGTSDAFVEDVQLINKIFTDKEVEIILKGRNEINEYDNYYNQLAEIYHNPNLIPNFKDKRWNRNPYTSVSDDGKTFTLNATEGTWNTSNVEFDVMPNNKYQLKFTKDKANHYVDIAERHNNTNINVTFCVGINRTGEIVKDFVVSDKTTKLKIIIACNKEGTYKVSNLELRRCD